MTARPNFDFSFPRKVTRTPQATSNARGPTDASAVRARVDAAGSGRCSRGEAACEWSSGLWRRRQHAWACEQVQVALSGAMPETYAPRVLGLEPFALQPVESTGMTAGATAVLERKRRQLAREAASAHVHGGGNLRHGGGDGGGSSGSAAGAGILCATVMAQPQAATISTEDEIIICETADENDGNVFGPDVAPTHRRTRRTDAVLALTEPAREGLERWLRCTRWVAQRQLAGRLGNARRRRGDG